MTEQTTSGEGADDVVHAAEYVLHLLSPGDRQAAEDRLAIDGRFRALVARWSEEFARLAADIAPVDPPERLRRSVAEFADSEVGTTRSARRERGRAPRRGSILGRLFGGGIGALAGAAAVTVLLVVALPRVEPPYSGPFFSGELGGEASLLVSAFVDPRYHTLTLELVDGAAPEGRVLQAWVIAEGEETPVPLGLLDGPSTTIVVPDDLAPAVTGGTLAISEEPPGGSPTGLPTGQVLATGTVDEV